MKELTDRQRELLLFIVGYLKTYLTMPTIREMCEGLELNGTNAIECHMMALQRKGYVIYRANRPRILTAKAREEFGLEFKGD